MYNVGDLHPWLSNSFLLKKITYLNAAKGYRKLMTVMNLNRTDTRPTTGILSPAALARDPQDIGCSLTTIAISGPFLEGLLRECDYEHQ